MARVLLVDDNEFIRASMARFLSAGGHEAHTAENGLDAREMMRRDVFDVIVMDLVMPRRQGLRVLGDLKRRGSTARVIAISGDGNRPPFQNLRTAESLGADLTLVKPFTGDTLLNWVNFLVELGPKKPKMDSASK